MQSFRLIIDTSCSPLVRRALIRLKFCSVSNNAFPGSGCSVSMAARRRTFSCEDSLPNLKVPCLKVTIERYLDSVKAFATEDEFNNTKRICESFLQKEGQQLQAVLKERETKHRNWIEEWWLQHGYLELRLPLPYMNFSGVPEFFNQFWHPKEGTQIERSSHSLHLLARFWKMLTMEKVDVHKGADGTVFSMDQFRTAYNTTQVPHRGADELACHFRTSSEGNCASHVIVICKGFLFKIDLFSSATGQPYTPPQFAKVLSSIVEKCEKRMGAAPGVACLTSLDRDSWADVRNHMIELSDSNRISLKVVDESVGVISMDGNSPSTCTDIMHNIVTGDPALRWRDKSYNEVWTKNGTMGACCAHSAMDGMVMVMYMEFSTAILKQCNGVWLGSKNVDDVSSVEELDFVVDNVVASGIEKGRQITSNFTNDLKLLTVFFDKFGKKDLKKLKVYPDAVAQIALQLAHMRMHGTPAPTYETATTRQFYHGRTETCRTCTPEVVEFCTAAMKRQNNTDPHVCALLRKAAVKFLYLMNECKNNRGCDRHLFGLAVAANRTGLPLPELYRDPLYVKSGGNGNFKLSTSFVGFFNSSGVVAPMTEDGYGFFYRIIDHKVVYTMTSWKHSSVTNLDRFREHIDTALCDVYEMFENIATTTKPSL